MYPFVTREFSENIRTFMDLSFTDEGGKIFPKDNRLRTELRQAIDATIFLNQAVHLTSNSQNRKMLMLRAANGIELPITTWSTGQREFIPLLSGIYYCLPPSAVRQKDKIQCVIIEELEMGLHPSAIISVMLLIMELLNRGYQVVLSTHSPAVLDVAWAIVEMKRLSVDHHYFLKIFDLRSTNYTIALAKNMQKKSIRVNYFKQSDNGVRSVDISKLDPGSASEDEWGWGGISGFSGRIADVVGEMVSKYEKV
jgi:predicted ATP-binding protein involved in virulence